MVAGVLVLALALGAFAFWKVDPLGVFAAEAKPARAAASHSPGPAEVHEANLRKLLDGRASALLKGDEAGWLAAVDRGDKGLVEQQRGIFRNLRAMGVDHYEYDIAELMSLPGGEIGMSAYAIARHCFGAKKCRPARSDAYLSLEEGDNGLVIAEYKPFGLPRPWELSDLRARVGKGVVVAA
ncbi:MAG: hypothetical protein ACRDJ9_16395, partial [Dehalococcoidia bacterium]